MPHTSFGVEAKARYWIEVRSKKELVEFLMDNEFYDQDMMVLGGGSNVLFVQDFDGIIIKNKLKGLSQIREDESHVWLKVGAGEIWHHLVQHCVEKGWGGIENLSLIPGSVGAAPIQNIGAYGVEFHEVFDHLYAFHIKTGIEYRFDKKDCAFGYRDSFFKRAGKGKYIITEVVLRLSKNPVLTLSYGAVKENLLAKDFKKPGIREVSEVICEIRKTKLPDPSEIGNGGSFFKNPIIDRKQFTQIQESFPELPFYPQQNENLIKLPAAWLIQHCGWKGFREGDVGVHRNQALVLVNYGKAKGKEIYDLSERIKISVKDTFGIRLEREVQVIT